MKKEGISISSSKSHLKCLWREQRRTEWKSLGSLGPVTAVSVPPLSDESLDHQPLRSPFGTSSSSLCTVAQSPAPVAKTGTFLSLPSGEGKKPFSSLVTALEVDTNHSNSSFFLFEALTSLRIPNLSSRSALESFACHSLLRARLKFPCPPFPKGCEGEKEGSSKGVRCSSLSHSH